MNAMAASRRFGICLLGVTAIVLLAEGGLLVRSQRMSDRASVRWKAKLQERSECEQVMPALTKENAARLEATLATAWKALAQAAAKLQVKDNAPALENRNGATATSTDAFFELAAFLDRMRQRAEDEGVALNPGERFGFSAYAEEPPAAELVSPVLRQARLAETLLGILFEAGPERLVSFQRELLTSGPIERATAAVARSATSASNRTTRDYFTPDAQRSLRRAGRVESSVFRVVFTGATRTLRSFLNDLADASLPVIVRSVEIERSEGETSSRGVPRRDRSASVMLGGNPSSEDSAAAVVDPVVVPVASNYTVVLEVVNFVGKMPDAGPAQPPVLG